MTAKNTLYYGDNLEILRRYVQDDAVDLIYLDPPFNSKATYNVLFEERDGTQAAAQIQAFEDTWHWDEAAARAYDETLEKGGRVSEAMRAFRILLGESSGRGGNDMLAYLSMMAPRLIELHRVLKDTGSIYLHCDPTASHYLKILLDSIFGPRSFRNEIVWKRTSGHSDAQRYGRSHDVILYYVRTGSARWNDIYQDYDESYVEQYYRYQDPDGRRFMSDNLSASSLQGGGYEYDWNGITRVWRCPKETMEELDRQGRIYYTKNGFPRRKRYLDEAKGLPAQDIWSDIEALRSWHQERLGYPTQKPEALLDRMIEASSSPGDVVLDPFCGCGTAIASAQRLDRRWIGIDITHLATNLVKFRLADAYEGREEELDYEVIGEPASFQDAATLAASSPFQFQSWALSLVKARQAEVRKGPDRGIDGRKYFHDEGFSGKTKQIILSVKGGKTQVRDVRELVGVLERESAQIGALISLREPTQPMKSEATSAGFYESPWGKHPRIQLLTVKGLLEGTQWLDFPQAGDRTFKKAPKARGNRAQQLQLGKQDHD